MSVPPEGDTGPEFSNISTGHLPAPEQVAALLAEAHARYKPNIDGKRSEVYPALARVPKGLFGLCVVRSGGDTYAAGDADYEFTIMSVSKPFVFALVCQAIGAKEARQKLGVNATGLPFDSTRSPRSSGAQADERTPW
jgi:glutaminase